MFEGRDEIVLVGVYGIVSICMYRCGLKKMELGLCLGEVWGLILGLGK